MSSIAQTSKKEILRVIQIVRRSVSISTLIRLSPILSFLPPFLILYYLYPWSFEQTFQGRTFYLFFLWLISLEMILEWEKLQKTKLSKKVSARTLLFIIVILLPAIYVIISNYFGLNTMIKDLANQNIPLEDPLREGHINMVPLSTEYLVFAGLFCLIIILIYGTNGLMDFSIGAFFLGAIGVLFTIDNLYPAGRSPIQMFVPATTALAANIFSLMGYQTTIGATTHPYYGYMTTLIVIDPNNPFRFAGFQIAWPCAGVESLLIYTVTILLFLKKTAIPWRHRIVYFAIGAAVTYFINALRIVTIFLLAMDYGFPSPQVQRFHDYYGMLYSVTWIISYPLIIIGSRALWGKIKNWRISKVESTDIQIQTKPL
jgi:exosortase/archaeosortase family protein